MPTFKGTNENDNKDTGYDTLFGRGGDDLLGSDQPGHISIFGGSGWDYLFIAVEATAIGTLRGGSGNDYIAGHLLADQMSGGSGDDLIVGSAPKFTGHNHHSVAPVEGSGVDLLNGGKGHDALYGFDGNDVIDGGDDSDRGSVKVPSFNYWADKSTWDIRAGLYGGDGFDTIYGGQGSDLLNGGANGDLLIGGTGADNFEYRDVLDSSPTGGLDNIQDFSPLDHDRIDLSHIDANTNKAGNQSFHFIGTHAFTNKAGELRFENGILYGDIDGKTGTGPAGAELEIVLSAVTELHAHDLVL